MNINWKLKSKLFVVIDFLSVFSLLYFFQKNISRRSRVSITQIEEAWRVHQLHLATIPKPKLIEFGAGKSLAQNIYLSNFVSEQVCVDLFEMLDISEFNNAAIQIGRIVNKNLRNVSNLDDIKRFYGIEYLAPFDLANSIFEDNTFAACISTDTLEHIPEDAIIKIFNELRRIIINNGIVSAVIDYSDHYSHTDKSISKLNFLSFTDAEFDKYNHKSHYQNRLRHYHFEDIFRKLGFDIVKSEALHKVTPPHKISNEFDIKSKSVFATRGVFLLRVKK